MNRQEMNNRSGAAYRTRREKNAVLLRLITCAIVVVTAIVTVLGLLLLILPAFRLKSIEIEGNTLYSDEKIIETTGLQVGQETLTVDRKAIRESIWKMDEAGYIDAISITVTPTSIKITLTEKQTIMYTEYQGRYVCLDRSFRVLNESANTAEYIENNFLRVKLPTIASLKVGERVTFAKEDIELSYVTELVDALQREGTLSSVTSFDFSQKYSVSYIIDGTCRVEVGRVGNLESKLATVAEILSRKGGVGALPAVVDVTDLQKPTYRVLASSDLLMGY